MKYIKYATRENNIYYRRRKRAVGSHTHWGERNPSGHSLHLKTESIMSAEERKNFRLPCGWTVAESWAALRKCWLAFDITKSQEDRQGMTEYAYRIRRIQAELNIPPTTFDSDILDENTVNRIDFLYRKSPPTSDEAVNKDEDSAAESGDMDYAQIMRGSDNSMETMPIPRQEIFSRKEKSCPSPVYQPNVLVYVQVTDFENSCYVGPPKPARKSKIQAKKIKTIYKKQCQVPPTNQDNFAASGPENTLAVPNPNRPPIEPILQRKSCLYQPPEDPPPHTIHKDKSCPSDLQVNQMQRNEKERADQRKGKSCRYSSQH